MRSQESQGKPATEKKFWAANRRISSQFLLLVKLSAPRKTRTKSWQFRQAPQYFLQCTCNNMILKALAHYRLESECRVGVVRCQGWAGQGAEGGHRLILTPLPSDEHLILIILLIIIIALFPPHSPLMSTAHLILIINLKATPLFLNHRTRAAQSNDFPNY